MWLSHPLLSIDKADTLDACGFFLVLLHKNTPLINCLSMRKSCYHKGKRQDLSSVLCKSRMMREGQMRMTMINMIGHKESIRLKGAGYHI